MLIMVGEKDHTIPPSVAHAACRKLASNDAVTDYEELRASELDSLFREIPTFERGLSSGDHSDVQCPARERRGSDDLHYQSVRRAPPR